MKENKCEKNVADEHKTEKSFKICAFILAVLLVSPLDASGLTFSIFRHFRQTVGHQEIY